MKRLLSLICIATVVLSLVGCASTKKQIDKMSNQSAPPYNPTAAKPVIYLYPEEKIDVDVTLFYDGELDFTYPEYDQGWSVTAYPDGTIINKADGKEYSYLFWEGHSTIEYDFTSGFVVKGSDTVSFLQEKLEYMGLTPKEYNEFIVYWLPQMKNNAYNLIAFQQSSYTDVVELVVSPEPDNISRVFMAFKPIENPIEIPEQNLPQLNREGFTVLEWGGCAVGEQ